MKISKFRHAPGFALVASVSMIILIILIAVAMLSLSRTTVLNANNTNAQNEARANARMALMFAIGELQMNLGPDQRISANAGILDHLSPQNPHWLGAWDSWKAGSSSTGSVDGYSEHSTISGVSSDNVAPTYTAGRDDHFIRWLVSMPEGDATDISSVVNDLSTADKFPDGVASSVKLIADQTAGSDSLKHVSVPLVDVDVSSSGFIGRYGWHISDSSQKAMLIYSDNAETQDVAKNIFDQSAAPGTGYTEIPGFESLSDPKEASRLVTLPTLDIIENNASGDETLAQKYYHDITRFSASVLADVRSGGLKSDLNTLLEREINVTETGDEFMLYKFDDNNRVPIQDLAAFYQLYDHDGNWSNGRRGGVELANILSSLKVTTPDAGGSNWNSVIQDRYLKAHNAMYMRPVPIKVHYVAGVSAAALTQADRDLVASTYQVSFGNRPGSNFASQLSTDDTHRLTVGITPIVTLWNPSNMPMVMDVAQVFRFCSPPLAFRWKLYRNGNLVYTDYWNNLSACIINESFAGSVNPWSPFIAYLRLKNESGGDDIVFEPGEVKVFSMEVAEVEKLTNTGQVIDRIIRKKYDAKPFWDPYGLQTTTNSAVGYENWRVNNHVYRFSTDVSNQNRQLVFRSGDELAIELGNEVANKGLSSPNWKKFLGRSISRGNEITGAPFVFEMMNDTFERKFEQFRNYQFVSRYGGGTGRTSGDNYAFNADIMAKGLPEGTIVDVEYVAASVATNEPHTPLIFPAGNDNLRIDLDDVIGASGNAEARGLFEFILAAGSEIMAKDSLVAGEGKLIPSRPFKHSSIIKSPFISEVDDANLYHYGWDWQVSRITDIEDSSVKIDQATNKGYWGGGYTPEQGVNNVIQMRLPVTPPVSVAALSHALLGGFSIANQGMVADSQWPYNYSLGNFGVGTTNPMHPVKNGNGDPLAFRRTTAYGTGGLGPFTFQAIGDSYAHPNIPADKAFTTKSITFKKEYGSEDIPFADHSYLANKAIWDRYFFSSITAQPDRLGVFEGNNKTAEGVATDFFINHNQLPNKRFVASRVSLSADDITALFNESDDFENGLADKIATYLMAEGSFNVNSTSTEAWKALLSGLKGEKLNLIVPQGNDYKLGDGVTLTDTPVGVASLQNADSFSSADLLDANNPINQWTGYRTISDDEIDELAIAIVKQVKLRGPFLSMSDFVNRRLDGSNTALSKLGALQAAIDDPDVSINAHFRNTPERTIGGRTGSNVDSSVFDFPNAVAASDPIAYGSNPYVDQSEILQNIGNQLTVRGDTFVIRAYGDALDQDGNVQARAWCEAEVQRTPEYLDASDEPHEDMDKPLSSVNQRFGRKFVITQFRWLSPNEL